MNKVLLSLFAIILISASHCAVNVVSQVNSSAFYKSTNEDHIRALELSEKLVRQGFVFDIQWIPDYFLLYESEGKLELIDPKLVVYLKSTDSVKLYYIDYLLFVDLPIERRLVDYLNMQISDSTLGKNKDKAYASFLLGKLYMRNQYFDEAKKHLKNGADFAKDAGLIRLFLRSSLSYAECLIAQKYYESAYISILNTSSVANNLGDDFFLMKTQMSMGDIQLELKNFDSALKYYNRAQIYTKKLNAFRQHAILLSSKGLCFLDEGKIKESITYFQNGLIGFFRVNDKYNIANSHLSLAKAYLEEDNLDLVKENLSLSQSFFEDVSDLKGLASVFCIKSKYYFKEKKYNNALFYSNKSIALRKELLNYAGLIDNYKLNAEIYNLTNNYEAAFQALNNYTKLTDSLKENLTKIRIAELNTLYQSEQNERLILKQKQEIENRENKQKLLDEKIINAELRNRQVTIFLVVLIVVVLILGLFYFLYQRQQKMKRYHKEIELQQSLLRLQMDPHFVFNAMSVIQGYIYDNDIDRSSKFLINFSKLMRLILEHSSKEFISLSLELEILERYLNVQKLRFEERFDFYITNDVQGNLDNLKIPPMVAQPFIENAIEHGQLHKKEDGLIVIRIEKDEKNKLVKFTIKDNGIGKDSAEEKNSHNSMAMNITKQRIDIFNVKYKVKANLTVLDLSNVDEQGTLVVFTVPYFESIHLS